MGDIVEKAGLRIDASTELEAWRANTLFDKEPETIAWIERYAGRGGVCYDIGANIGIYSIYAALRNPEVAVYAFEPVRQNYLALLKNIELNRLANVHPFQIALGASSQLADLYVRDLRIGNSGAQIDRPVDERGAEFAAKEVQKTLAVALDQLVSQYNFPPPNFVKIDVDGQESRIIRGMSKLLESDQLRSILVEFNSAEELAELTKLFQAAGLNPDDDFNNYHKHSRYRREKGGGTAMNWVFSR